MPPQPRSLEPIFTETPIDDMWNGILYGATVDGARKLISNRIAKGFFGLDHQGLSQSNGQRAGEFDDFRLVQASDIDGHSLEMSFCIRQAKEFYDSARNSSELTRPILYYYGMVSLAKSLILSTYFFPSPRNGHGIAADFQNETITLKKRGFFSRFHNSYDGDSSFYATERRLTLKDIFSTIPELASEYQMLYNQPSLVPFRDPESVMDTHHIVTIDGTSLTFPALTSHFLAMFYLGSLARYRPKDWGIKIQSEEMYIIRKFLSVSARRFPNVILNELRGKTQLFYSPGRWG